MRAAAARRRGKLWRFGQFVVSALCDENDFSIEVLHAMCDEAERLGLLRLVEGLPVEVKPGPSTGRGRVRKGGGSHHVDGNG